ncbi:MAG: 5,6-dimethylbenzimidazole synthase [Caulobacteraceae bacterium]|nr:5,6-dimethylbenzimidazole synthase [Caulobacteraceae bacterium]
MPETIAERLPPDFDEDFRAKLHDLLVWRRDVRRFRRDPIADSVVDRLIAAACLAPSVGLSQPWRFVTVDDPARRAAITANFRRCNGEALAAYAGEAAADYAKLKLAGLEEAPHHLAVFADEATMQGRGLGRATMPETLRYSVVAAVCNLWLAARAEGIGVGWVSILDPKDAAAALDAPPDWTLIGYFCIGYPETWDDTPELERERWARRAPCSDFVFRR